jgi:hypothetical protein
MLSFWWVVQGSNLWPLPCELEIHPVFSLPLSGKSLFPLSDRPL